MSIALQAVKDNRVYCESMGNKLCPKVILEGTRLTFKTEIAFELNGYSHMPDEE